MATIINYSDTPICVKARFVGEDCPKWSHGFKKKHFKVTVSANEAVYTFDFWGNTRTHKPMVRKELIEAFEMFLSEAIDYDNCKNIDDFQAEFGFEKVSECIDAYDGCKKSWEAWKKFHIDAYELDNWLRETFNI